MNNTLENFARDQILRNLKNLPNKNVVFFKRIYSIKSGCALDSSIEDIVKNLPSEYLDWALTQVENTLKRYKI